MPKQRSHRRQHYVPRCYLKAWIDPESRSAPPREPYVWTFEADGSNPRAKAPANIFTETDLYTIAGADGERDLRLEHGLQEVEDHFTRVRNLCFSRDAWPDAKQMRWAHLFAATARVRTQAMRNHHGEQFQAIADKMARLQQEMDTATPEKRAQMARVLTTSSSRGKHESSGATIEHVREAAKSPIPLLMHAAVPVTMRAFARMHTAVLCTDDPLGFVTTDDPCTWYDPESYKLPPFWRGPGLAVRSIEVTLPLSPSQCLFISHEPGFTGYIRIETEVVDALNRRHISHCDRQFVACRNAVRAAWFVQPALPEDAWEVQQKKRDHQPPANSSKACRTSESDS